MINYIATIKHTHYTHRRRYSRFHRTVDELIFPFEVSHIVHRTLHTSIYNIHNSTCKLWLIIYIWWDISCDAVKLCMMQFVQFLRRNIGQSSIYVFDTRLCDNFEDVVTQMRRVFDAHKCKWKLFHCDLWFKSIKTKEQIKHLDPDAWWKYCPDFDLILCCRIDRYGCGCVCMMYVNTPHKDEVEATAPTSFDVLKMRRIVNVLNTSLFSYSKASLLYIVIGKSAITF